MYWNVALTKAWMSTWLGFMVNYDDVTNSEASGMIYSQYLNCGSKGCEPRAGGHDLVQRIKARAKSSTRLCATVVKMKHTMEHDENMMKHLGKYDQVILWKFNWPLFSRFQNFGRSPKWFFLKKTKSRRSPVSCDEGDFFFVCVCLCVFFKGKFMKVQIQITLTWTPMELWNCPLFYSFITGGRLHGTSSSCFSALPLPISKFLPKLPAHLETTQWSRCHLGTKNKVFGGIKTYPLRKRIDLIQQANYSDHTAQDCKW